MNFGNFVYICITRGKSYHFREDKYIQNLQTSQGYIFRVSTNFEMLFLTVVNDFVLPD